MIVLCHGCAAPPMTTIQMVSCKGRRDLFYRLTFPFILVPLCISLLASWRASKRHSYGHDLCSTVKKGHGSGNYSFAIVALLSIYVFVPSHFRHTTAQYNMNAIELDSCHCRLLADLVGSNYCGWRACAYGAMPACPMGSAFWGENLWSMIRATTVPYFLPPHVGRLKRHSISAKSATIPTLLVRVV